LARALSTPNEWRRTLPPQLATHLTVRVGRAMHVHVELAVPPGFVHILADRSAGRHVKNRGGPWPQSQRNYHRTVLTRRSPMDVRRCGLEAAGRHGADDVVALGRGRGGWRALRLDDSDVS